jgi:chemotaxis response regulator CheB
MPAEAIKCGAAERVVPLQDVAPTMLTLARKQQQQDFAHAPAAAAGPK